MDRDEIIQLIQETVRQALETHIHSGNESRKLPARSIVGVPKDAITDSAITLTTGGTENMKAADTNAIYLLEDKVNEILTVLRDIGIIRE